MDMINFDGLLIGIATFLIIGARNAGGSFLFWE